MFKKQKKEAELKKQQSDLDDRVEKSEKHIVCLKEGHDWSRNVSILHIRPAKGKKKLAVMWTCNRCGDKLEKTYKLENEGQRKLVVSELLAFAPRWLPSPFSKYWTF